MATSEFVPKPAKSERAFSLGLHESLTRRSTTPAAVTAAMMMATDVTAVLISLCLASVFRFAGPTAPSGSAISRWAGIALPLHPGYLFFFIAVLLVVNHRYRLYGPLQTHSFWHELRRTIEACFAAGLLLCGSLYVTHNTSISRALIGYLLCLTTFFLCTLRMSWRHSRHRRYELGLDTRNVLILGATPLGKAIRKKILRNSHLGRSFKGFLQSAQGSLAEEAGDFPIGEMAQLPLLARQHFIDEVIIAERCSTDSIVELIEMARDLDVEVLVVPGFYEELTPEAPIEYLGDFPVVALHRRNGKVIAHLFKRLWDFTVSTLLLLALSPTLLGIALLIKLDSSGPVLYTSDRVGKKGRIFPCFKFRTMVANAEQMKASLSQHNERDGILFKMKNDPRVTRVGRVLRKFSLDELPQLLNVLRGDMSLVGPRPPIASEVQRYQVQHFRRLEVLPGLTGLWQVRARQDPSFERYVSLDLAYVENWSFWLDLKILVRTAEVVLRGTGS
ncbi:MAG TPA: sugar transferase [Acidobacteriaceae bacterium]|nr:sugar transferase [Acidobacteriaceae bacterium]